MTTQRLTSFTDCVIAVIITVMVLELPVPKEAGMEALQPLTILFVVYALSFVKVGIYWSQHHNILQASKRVNGQVLAENTTMLRMCAELGFHIEDDPDAKGIKVVRLEVGSGHNV